MDDLFSNSVLEANLSEKCNLWKNMYSWPLKAKLHELNEVICVINNRICNAWKLINTVGRKSVAWELQSMIWLGSKLDWVAWLRLKLDWGTYYTIN